MTPGRRVFCHLLNGALAGAALMAFLLPAVPNLSVTP